MSTGLNENIEKTEVTEDPKIRVSDEGEIEVKVKESTEESKPDPKEGQSEEGSSKEGAKTETTETKVESKDITLEPQYAGKSVEEVAKMHKELEKKLGEQSTKTQSTEEGRTTEDATKVDTTVKAISLKEQQATLNQEKLKLAKMTAFDDEYDDQVLKVNALETDFLAAQSKSLIVGELNTKQNAAFIVEQKVAFQKNGVDLSDEDFDKATELAQGYLEDGRLTEGSYMKALTDLVGPEKVTKYFTVKGEQKAREDIKNASAKVETKVDVAGTGKAATYVKLSSLSRQQMDEHLDNLSGPELDDLVNKMGLGDRGLGG